MEEDDWDECATYLRKLKGAHEKEYLRTVFYGDRDNKPDPIEALLYLSKFYDMSEDKYELKEGARDFFEEFIHYKQKQTEQAEYILNKKVLYKGKLSDLINLVTVIITASQVNKRFIPLFDDFCLFAGKGSNLFLYHNTPEIITIISKIFMMEYVDRESFIMQVVNENGKIREQMSLELMYQAQSQEYTDANNFTKPRKVLHLINHTLSLIDQTSSEILMNAFFDYLYCCLHNVNSVAFKAYTQGFFVFIPEIEQMLNTQYDDVFDAIYYSCTGDEEKCISFDYGYCLLLMLYQNIPPALKIDEWHIPSKLHKEIIVPYITCLSDLNDDIIFDFDKPYQEIMLEPLLYYINSSILYSLIVLPDQSLEETMQMLSIESSYNGKRQFYFSIVYGYYMYIKQHKYPGDMIDSREIYSLIFENFPLEAQPKNYIKKLEEKEVDPKIQRDFTNIVDILSHIDFDNYDQSLMEDIHLISNICLWNIAQSGMHRIAKRRNDAQLEVLADNLASIDRFIAVNDTITINDLQLDDEGKEKIVEAIEAINTDEIPKLIKESLLQQKNFVLYIALKNIQKLRNTFSNFRRFAAKYPIRERLESQTQQTQQIDTPQNEPSFHYLSSGSEEIIISDTEPATQVQPIRYGAIDILKKSQDSSASSGAVRYQVPPERTVYLHHIIDNDEWEYVELTPEEAREYEENDVVLLVADKQNLQQYIDEMTSIMSKPDPPSDARVVVALPASLANPTNKN